MNRWAWPARLAASPAAALSSSATAPCSKHVQTKQFDRLEQFAKLQAAPPVKFKDLEEVVTHKISVNLMPFDVRADFVKVTSDTVLVPSPFRSRIGTHLPEQRRHPARHGQHLRPRHHSDRQDCPDLRRSRFRSMCPPSCCPRLPRIPRSTGKLCRLRISQNRYRLDIVVKDVNGDRTGTWSRGIVIPDFSEDHLSIPRSSSPTRWSRSPTKNVGTGSFVIGTTKVRPRVASVRRQAHFL